MNIVRNHNNILVDITVNILYMSKTEMSPFSDVALCCRYLSSSLEILTTNDPFFVCELCK